MIDLGQKLSKKIYYREQKSLGAAFSKRCRDAAPYPLKPSDQLRRLIYEWVRSTSQPTFLESDASQGQFPGLQEALGQRSSLSVQPSLWTAFEGRCLLAMVDESEQIRRLKAAYLQKKDPRS